MSATFSPRCARCTRDATAPLPALLWSLVLESWVSGRFEIMGFEKHRLIVFCFLVMRMAFDLCALDLGHQKPLRAPWTTSLPRNRSL